MADLPAAHARHAQCQRSKSGTRRHCLLELGFTHRLKRLRCFLRHREPDLHRRVRQRRDLHYFHRPRGEPSERRNVLGPGGSRLRIYHEALAHTGANHSSVAVSDGGHLLGRRSLRHGSKGLVLEQLVKRPSRPVDHTPHPGLRFHRLLLSHQRRFVQHGRNV